MAGKICVHVRELSTSQDINDVLTIANEDSRRSVYLSQDDFIAEDKYILVAEYSERVVGFLVFSLHANRMLLRNVAAHFDMRRRGIGSWLMVGLFDLLPQKKLGFCPSHSRRDALSHLRFRVGNHHCDGIDLRVRETNMDAILFFYVFGFRARQVIPNYYRLAGGRLEDAYTMHFRCPRQKVQARMPVNRISRYL